VGNLGGRVKRLEKARQVELQAHPDDRPRHLDVERCRGRLTDEEATTLTAIQQQAAARGKWTAEEKKYEKLLTVRLLWRYDVPKLARDFTGSHPLMLPGEDGQPGPHLFFADSAVTYLGDTELVYVREVLTRARARGDNRLTAAEVSALSQVLRRGARRFDRVNEERIRERHARPAGPPGAERRRAEAVSEV